MIGTDCVDITVCTNGELTYDEVGGHLRPAGTGPVEIDLTRLRFIDPAGLVSLAVIAERATLLRRPVRFRKPEGADVANYLTRMRLGEQLSGLDVVHDLPSVRERRLGHRLVELRRFDGEAGLDTVAAVSGVFCETFASLLTLRSAVSACPAAPMTPAAASSVPPRSDSVGQAAVCTDPSCHHDQTSSAA